MRYIAVIALLLLSACATPAIHTPAGDQSAIQCKGGGCADTGRPAFEPVY